MKSNLQFTKDLLYPLLISVLFSLFFIIILGKLKNNTFGSPDEDFRFLMVKNLRSTSFNNMSYFNHSWQPNDRILKFYPFGHYVRFKEGKLIAQFRPFFPYLANLFYDGKNSKLLIIPAILFSLFGGILFYYLCRIFLTEKEALFLSLFYILGTPFLTYSFRLLDVNIAVCVLIAVSLLILKFENKLIIPLAFILGLGVFIFFKTESALYLFCLCLSLFLLNIKKNISKENLSKAVFFLAIFIISFILIGSNIEHVQKHVFSKKIITKSYLNIPKRLNVVDTFFFNPQPFSLGLRQFTGYPSFFHLSGLTSILLISLIIVRKINYNIAMLLAHQKVVIANTSIMSIALLYLLLHKSSNPLFLNRYSLDLLILITITLIMLLTQISYFYFFNRVSVKMKIELQYTKEFKIVASLFIFTICVLLIQNKMVRGMFTSTPYLILAFFSIYLQDDKKITCLKYLFFSFLFLAILAPTQGGYQWGPRYLQSIIPIGILLSWLSFKNLENLSKIFGIRINLIKYFFNTLLILTVLMTVKGTIFIISHINYKNQNATILQSLDVDYIFHKNPIEYPNLINKSYSLKNEDSISKLLDAIDKEKYIFAVYNLNVERINDILNKSRFDYEYYKTKKIIIDTSPDSDQRHSIYIYKVNDRQG